MGWAEVDVALSSWFFKAHEKNSSSLSLHTKAQILEIFPCNTASDKDRIMNTTDVREIPAYATKKDSHKRDTTQYPYKYESFYTKAIEPLCTEPYIRR